MCDASNRHYRLKKRTIWQGCAEVDTCTVQLYVANVYVDGGVPAQLSILHMCSTKASQVLACCTGGNSVALYD